MGSVATSERDGGKSPYRGRDAAASSCASVSAAFTETAHRFADRCALSCGREHVSYAELETRSNAIAQGLISRGVRPGATIGLSMPRSTDTIAAILGVLKAGAAYVPFDPSYPPQLLEFIRNDSAPSLVLVQRAPVEPAVGAAFAEGSTLDVASDFPPLPAGRALHALPEVAPGDRAYIMYTSGSTGRPKGVQIPHRAILRLVIDNDFAHFGPDETILQLAPLAFDASTFEIWGALLHGGRLAIVPAPQPALDEIARAIAEQQVTTAWLTAGLFHLMVDHQLAGLKPLRQLLAGGDVLSVAHVERALRGLPDCRLINGYGPTENTTFSCCYTIPRPLPPGPIAIGTAIRNSEALILDAALQPVAVGADGELFVGGPGLALGYLNRPELDAERFIAHPFDTTPGARLYRTGDRVRRRADGNIEFLGRVDRQLKINGKRVELDEIEATLRRSGLVGDAAVTVFAGAAGQRRIAAFVTPPAGATLALDALREFLREQLPDYMQPASITVLDVLPLSPTGKVDRAKLSVPTGPDPSARAPRTAPANELEAGLLRIWQQVLGTEAVGVDDNFFDVGGTSLQMMKVHAAIQSELGRSPTLVDLFTYTRIRALAAWLARPATDATNAVTRAQTLDALERARRQSAALARARPTPRTPPSRTPTR